MHNSNQDSLDRRINSGMDESPGITIEFLRACLSSERSVSRSARQRADELEKMVEELEEKLQIVSLQRRMAEKATADVLAILENQGESVISEGFDSSSDHENFQESKMDNNSKKKEDNFSISERRNKHELHSGSNIDSSSIPGRRLSWQGRIDLPGSREKYKEPSIRRRSTSTGSGSSSSRHNHGKSCRQIKHRETRSVVDSKFEPEKFDDAEEKGVAVSSEGLSNCSYRDPERYGSESQKKKILPRDALTESKEDERNGGPDFNGHGRNKDMERALEHQAQLIGQNEEMEMAQREWEEKLRENDTQTPDSCDPENHSDVTEERDEIKTSFSAEINSPEGRQSKSEARVSCLLEEKTKTHGYLPPSDLNLGGMQDQMNRSTVVSASPVQESAFPPEYERKTQKSLNNSGRQPPPGSHHDSPLLVSSHNRSSVASSDDSSFHNTSGSRNDLYALVPHDSQERLGSVLDALKQAKLSLQKKITGLPVVDDTSVEELGDSSIPAVTTGNGVDIPGGYGGLFRLPTDYAVQEAANKHSYLGLESSVPSSRYFPEKGMAASSTDHFVTNRYVESRPPFNHGSDRFIASPYLENRQSLSSGAGDRFFSSPYTETRRSFSSDVAGQIVVNPSTEIRPPFSNNFGDRFVPQQYFESRPTFSTSAGDQIVTGPYLETRPTFSSDATGRYVTNRNVEIRPDFPVNVGHQFVTSASGETRSSFSADNRFHGVHSAESWSGVSTPVAHFVPYLDMGKPTSRYSNPTGTTYQNYPTFPEPTHWTTSNVAAIPFRQGPAVSPTYHLSSYDELSRLGMYR